MTSLTTFVWLMQWPFPSKSAARPLVLRNLFHTWNPALEFGGGSRRKQGQWSLKHSRYKYFSKLDHANKFMGGKVYHQTLAFFRDYEDKAAKQIIGDEFESTRIFRPVDGLQINNHTQGTNGPLQMGFESSARAGEIYVFCVSLTFTDELKKEFGAVACVEIQEPLKFIQRWLAGLPEGASDFAKKVDYYRQDHGPANVWPQSHLIATTKLNRFAYQQEYRFGFCTTNALDFGQTTQVLRDRKVRPVPKPEEHDNKTLDLGDLSDICKLYEF